MKTRRTFNPSNHSASADVETAAERMLLMRADAAPKLKRRELERLVMLLMITHPKHHRQAIALCRFHGLDDLHVGELLRISGGRVREIVRSAERRLRNHLADIQRDDRLAKLTGGQGDA